MESFNLSDLSRDYIRDGYVVRPSASIDALSYMREVVVKASEGALNLAPGTLEGDGLNFVHKYLKAADLNEFRLEIIKAINADEEFKTSYFKLVQPYLDELVGNELVMQIRINLSIQLPDDSSSLLPIHGDTWSGDSPYEIVAWVPLVNCYKTKAMYILPVNKYHGFINHFSSLAKKSSEDWFNAVASDVQFLKVDFGQVLLFNQTLPHGNRVNVENETRWSMNCRFKSIFTPYGDKKLGEFFEPITLKPVSLWGMSYKMPGL